MTEHHFHTEGGEACPNQALMFADFAARTERLNFAPMSTVITTHDPIRVSPKIGRYSINLHAVASQAFA